jgi:acyl-coenzyme A thioesterase PaaI-like protein
MQHKQLDIPPHHTENCWGCGDNEFGLHLPSPAEEGQREYEATVRFTRHHEAGPGLVHGGLVAAALDEACGLLATWYRFPCVTGRLFVHYRRPVPINADLRVHAAIEREQGRRIYARGELRDGVEVLASARATFVHVSLEHFLATPEGRAAGEAWRRRLAQD